MCYISQNALCPCTPISYAYFVNNFHKVYFCGYRCPDHFINILNLVYFYISLPIYWEPLCQLCSTFVEEQAEGTSVQAEQSGSHAVSDEENDQFWCLDDVPGGFKYCTLYGDAIMQISAKLFIILQWKQIIPQMIQLVKMLLSIAL